MPRKPLFLGPGQRSRKLVFIRALAMDGGAPPLKQVSLTETATRGLAPPP